MEVDDQAGDSTDPRPTQPTSMVVEQSTRLVQAPLNGDGGMEVDAPPAEATPVVVHETTVTETSVTVPVDSQSLPTSNSSLPQDSTSLPRESGTLPPSLPPSDTSPNAPTSNGITPALANGLAAPAGTSPQPRHSPAPPRRSDTPTQNERPNPMMAQVLQASSSRSSPVPRSSSPQRMVRSGFIYDPLMMLHCQDGYTPTAEHIMDNGDGHPEEPMRIHRIFTRLAEQGIIKRMKKLEFSQVTFDQIRLVHTEDHWNRVQGTESE